MANGVRRKSNVFGHLRYFLKKWRLPVASAILISGCITAIVFIVPMINNVNIKDKYTKAISTKLKELLNVEYKVINKNEAENKVEYLFEKNGEAPAYQATSYMNAYENYDIKIVNHGDVAPKYISVTIEKIADMIDVSVYSGNNTSSINTKVKSGDELKEGIKEVVSQIAQINVKDDKEKDKNVATVFTFKGAKEPFQTREEALNALWESSSSAFKWIIEGPGNISGPTKQEAIASWIAHEKATITKKTSVDGLPNGTLTKDMPDPTSLRSFDYFIYKDKTYETNQQVIDSITSLSTSLKPKKITIRVRGSKEYRNKEEMSELIIKNDKFEIKG